MPCLESQSSQPPHPISALTVSSAHSILVPLAMASHFRFSAQDPHNPLAPPAFRRSGQNNIRKSEAVLCTVTASLAGQRHAKTGRAGIFPRLPRSRRRPPAHVPRRPARAIGGAPLSVSAHEPREPTPRGGLQSDLLDPSAHAHASRESSLR